MEIEGSLHDSALTRLVGGYRWVEQSLFRLLGSWAPLVSQPPIKIFLDEQSFEYSWHAELWADRLPSGPEGMGLTAPTNNAVAALFRDLADSCTSAAALEKLVTVYRVLIPRLISTYKSHLDHLEPDPKMQRALRLVLSDELVAWQAGEMLIQTLLVDENAVTRASEQQRHVEMLVLRAGGLANLDDRSKTSELGSR